MNEKNYIGIEAVKKVQKLSIGLEHLTRTHTLTQKDDNVINTGRRGVGLTQLKPAHL